MNVLVLNAGSSTLKFQLVRTDEERMLKATDERLARGQYERIGGETIYSISTPDAAPVRGTAPLRDHRAAIDHLLGWLASDASSVPISSIADLVAQRVSAALQNSLPAEVSLRVQVRVYHVPSMLAR